MSTQNNERTAKVALTDASEDLRSIAADFCAMINDRDVSQQVVHCTDMMRDGAEALRDGLALAEYDPRRINEQETHDLRNHLNIVSSSIQRLKRLVQDGQHGVLDDELSTVEQVCGRLAGLPPLSPRRASSVDDTESGDSKMGDSKMGDSKMGARSDKARTRPSLPLPNCMSAEAGRVLIVDDDWRACSELEEYVESRGHMATSCRRPERVMELLRESVFDVCLVDVNMPTMSGWDLVKQIKADVATKHVSVIVISGVDEDKNATRAVTLGADDFITKPVNLDLLAARIVNCLSRARQHLRELLRFLPLPIVETIRKDPQRLQQGHEATVTVMFCDIRRFSWFSEQMSSSETIRWISDVMDNLSQDILDGGGTLVDFVGDEVMAMWGAPQADGAHAEAACRCALKIQETLKTLNDSWRDTLGDTMELGIGIHSGIVSVGNTGSAQRFKYGPLGNTVNLASRVQGAGKYLRSRILMTRETCRQLPRDIAFRRLCSVRVNNIQRPVELFELTVDDTPIMKARDGTYEESLVDFESGDIDAAIVRLGRLLTEHPNDGPSLLLMGRLIEAKLSHSEEVDTTWTLPGK